MRATETSLYKYFGYGLALTVAVLWSAALFVPWFPLIDASSAEYLQHVAYASHWHLGTQVITQYGPIGFVGLSIFHPTTYELSLFLNLLIFLASLVWLNQFWRRSTGRSISAIWIAALCTLPALSPSAEWGPILIWPYLLTPILVGLHFSESDGWNGSIKWSLAAALGILALIKMDLLIVTTAAFIVITVDDFLHRRFCWIAFFGFGTLFFTWLGTGQSHVPIFIALRGGLEAGTGYREVYALWSPRSNVAALFFLASAGTFWWLITDGIQRDRLRDIWPALFWAADLYLIFVHGFLRADKWHTLTSWYTLALLMVFIGPRIFSSLMRERTSRRIVASFCLVFFMVGFGFSAAPLSPLDLLHPLEARLKRTVHFVHVGTTGLRNESDQYQKDLRTSLPLPPLAQPISMAQGNIGVVLSKGYNFRPWPSVESDAACTPALARLNRAFLESPDRPATILWQPAYSPLDNYVPTVLDNVSYLPLVTHYRLAHILNQQTLIFTRREKTLRMESRVIERVVGALDRPMPVPQTGTNPIWVKIKLQQTCLGRFVSLAFKAVPLQLELSRGKTHIVYELPFKMSREGFVLQGDMRQPFTILLYSIHDKVHDSLQPVTSLTVREATSPSLGRALHFYDHAVTFEFDCLTFAEPDKITSVSKG